MREIEPMKKERKKRRHSLFGRSFMKNLLEENAKLRKELEEMENRLAEFQAVMPNVYDSLEDNANEINYLKSALESSEKKYQMCLDKNKKMEMRMQYSSQDLRDDLLEHLNKISTESVEEVEGTKNRFLQEFRSLSQELSIESQERNIVMNDLVQVKQQLSKLRKDRDDEREKYLLHITELERSCRMSNKEKNKYRNMMEDLREQIFGVEADLQEQIALVSEKEELLETLREDYTRSKNTESADDRSGIIISDNFAVEISHNENVIAELRQEKMASEAELDNCRVQVENILEQMEYSLNAIATDGRIGEGIFQLERAIEATRDWLGFSLSPLPVGEPDPVSETEDLPIGLDLDESTHSVDQVFETNRNLSGSSDCNKILGKNEVVNWLNDNSSSTSVRGIPPINIDATLTAEERSPHWEMKGYKEEFKEEVFNQFPKTGIDLLKRLKLEPEKIKLVTAGRRSFEYQEKRNIELSKKIGILESQVKTYKVELATLTQVRKIEKAEQSKIEDLKKHVQEEVVNQFSKMGKDLQERFKVLESASEKLDELKASRMSLPDKVLGSEESLDMNTQEIKEFKEEVFNQFSKLGGDLAERLKSVESATKQIGQLEATTISLRNQEKKNEALIKKIFSLESQLETLQKKKLEEFKPEPTSFTQIQEFKEEVRVEVVNQFSKIGKDFQERFKVLEDATQKMDGLSLQHADPEQNLHIEKMQEIREYKQVMTNQFSKMGSDLAERLKLVESVSEQLGQLNARLSLKDQEYKNEQLSRRIAELELQFMNKNAEVEYLEQQHEKDAVLVKRLKAEVSKKFQKASLVKSEQVFERYRSIRRNIRLDSFQGMGVKKQRNCVISFLEKYSHSQSWIFHSDPNLHTTLYVFDFDGTVWKTRISFLYPFVNYLTQVTGVNKKTIGSVSVIMPTSTVGTKVRRLSSSFNQIQKTLETHNSEKLWDYIFIFLKNVSTHYGHIKHYVGSRTRTIHDGSNRRSEMTELSGGKSVKRKSRKRRKESRMSKPRSSADRIAMTRKDTRSKSVGVVSLPKSSRIMVL